MFSVVSVCLCVCLSVCPSRCMSVQAITFEPLHLETLFLAYRYIFTISRSSLSINVIESRSRSYETIYNSTYLTMLILCMLLQIINKIKVTHQDQGCGCPENVGVLYCECLETWVSVGCGCPGGVDTGDLR